MPLSPPRFIVSTAELGTMTNDQRAFFLQAFEQHVYGAQVQRGGIIHISLRRLGKGSRDPLFGFAQNHTRLTFTLGLRPARYGILFHSEYLPSALIAPKMAAARQIAKIVPAIGGMCCSIFTICFL